MKKFDDINDVKELEKEMYNKLDVLRNEYKSGNLDFNVYRDIRIEVVEKFEQRLQEII